MATFLVRYSDGTEKAEVASDCSTVEQFFNTRFGTCSNVQDVEVRLAEPIQPESKKEAKKK